MYDKKHFQMINLKLMKIVIIITSFPFLEETVIMYFGKISINIKRVSVVKRTLLYHTDQYAEPFCVV